jgi:hypothetical protein
MKARVMAGVAALVAMMMLAATLPAAAVSSGFYYCGAANNLPTSGPSYHRSGPHASWYFNADRCASFKQLSSSGIYYSQLLSGTFASLKITSMHVPDAIEDTVYFERAEYATKYGVLCTAFPTFGAEPMGNGEGLNWGTDANTGDVTEAYLIDKNGHVTTISMYSTCTSGNHWTSNVKISPSGFNPYVQWVFGDGTDSGNDQFSVNHFTYKL